MISQKATDTITVDSSPASTTNTNTNTPNTRKRTRNYAILNEYGLDRSPEPGSPTPSTRKRAPKKASQQPTSQQIASQTQQDKEVEEDDTIVVSKDSKKAWFWQYYTVKVLDTTWEKGTGRRKKVVPDELYTCKVDTKTCKFVRRASKLHSSTSGLSEHIEHKHQISKDGKASSATTLTTWMSSGTISENVPDFPTALVDWIVADCQAFTVTESSWFQTMMKAAGCDQKILKGDAIANRVQARVARIEQDTAQLLEKTCVTVALSLDGWTSQNSVPFLGINANWLGPDFKVYRVCIAFKVIDGTHSGESLADLVFKVLKRLNILHKLLSITGDNASNNNTLTRHLFNKLSRLYDQHLSKLPIRGATMRFDDKTGQIRCFAHVLNLVCKAILKSLGSSTHKDASDFLDRVERHKWDKITLPMAAGDIAVLRVIILWISRSPQRLQEWDQRAPKRVPYDVDNRWNYSLRMIEYAFDCRAALTDTVKDNPELYSLELTPERWERLGHIRTLLRPFDDFTKWVSRQEPTIQLSASLYVKLQNILNSIIKKEGEFAEFDATLVDAAKAGLTKFNEYFQYVEENDTYWIACVLDPRIKTNWLRRNTSDPSGIISRIKKYLKESYPLTMSDKTQEPPQKRKKGLDFELLEEYGSRVTFDDDIDRYFNTEVVGFAANIGEDHTQWVLNWWNSNKSEFPRMAAVARDYLAIPSSEVDIERLFSGGRDILGIRRFALKGATIGDLMICKDELRRQKSGQM